MPSKCDIIRKGARVMVGGACASKNPPPGCAVTDLATKKDIYFRTQFEPKNAFTAAGRLVRRRELAVIRSDISDDVAKVRRAYGAAPDIAWNDFTSCLWDPSGLPGGPHGNIYFGRDDLSSLGYQPRPVLSAKFLEKRVPAALTNQIPVYLDRVLSPELAVVVIFVLLVVIFGVLVLKAYEDGKKNLATPLTGSSS